MKYLVTSIAILVLSATAYADNFTLGEQTFNIPQPKEFHRLTKDMDPAYRLIQQIIDQRNDRLGYYISKNDLSKAKAGDIPLFKKYFVLKVSKRLKNARLDTKFFTQLKNDARQANENDLKSLQEKIPDLFDKTSESIRKEFDLDTAIKITKLIPLKPHRETKNSFSYSMYINYGGKIGGSETESFISATATMLHIKDKVLFLFCYGEQKDLAWTRTASRKWEESILSSNR
ncbi:MAG: hypothetical protein OEZ39_16640 [Gammaproteobacteria bacterium]|nr:hypothetical protein [Gammaproteobacteria bacterium]MDH5653488.1 hypothetical protein [Gammaproteobacteria bacterium]